MAPNAVKLLGLALALTLQPAACSFSLDTVSKDVWYYVHNHLADTTSQACLEAYAAPIDCDDTLLKLVSSESPNFDPGPADLERTCVKSCSDALDAYVQNVKDVCTEDGDAALVSANVRPKPRVPVSVVGEVFQYEYAWSCSKNSSGWCYLDYPTSREWARADFTCGNGCAEQFFANAHDLPGSQYWFMVYELAEKSDWWKTQWDEGWDHLVECNGGKGASSMSPTALESQTSTRTATGTDGAENTSSSSDQSSGTGATTTATVMQTATVTTGLPTDTATSNARRLRSPFAGIW